MSELGNGHDLVQAITIFVEVMFERPTLAPVDSLIPFDVPSGA